MKKFYKSRFNFSVVLLFMLVLCQWSVGYAQTCTATVTGTVGLSTQGNVNELVYGNGIYVAAGSRGGIYMSTDGKAWSAVKNSTFNNSTYVGLVFGNGRFVATAGNATLVTSTDGISWTLMSMPGAANLGKVAFGNGMFITMASTGGMSYRSTDGVNWTAKATGAMDNTNNIIFANGAFMAGEYVNSVGSYSYTSTDGITWVKRTIGTGTSNLNRLSYINNKFWTFHSGGAIYSSADGITWAQLTDPVGNTTDPGTQAFGGLWDGSKYFFFGTGGGNSSAIWTSTNGTAFTLQPKSIRMTASNAAFVNGKYFMLGSGTPISYSDNGTDWFYVTSDQNAMVKGGGKYVTVGNVGTLGGQIMTSTDFSSWTKLPVNNIPSLYGVVYANSKFTAVGEVGAVLNSTDGTTWTAATSNFATRLNSVVNAQGLYVAAGVAGIIRSTDGVNWTSSYGGTGTPTFTKVKFLNNQFIAVGSIRANNVTSGVVFTSPDGITWTDATPNTSATPAYFTGIAWSGTQYLLTGLERTTGKFISMMNTDLSVKTGYTDILKLETYGSDGTRGDAVYERGVFVSAANSLTTPFSTVVLTSRDGKSWTTNDYVNTNVVSSSYVTAIFADANDFKLLGTHDGRLATAPSCAITTPTNTPPTVTLVTVTGTATVGQTLTGTYSYADVESNPESGSTFKWYRSDNASGLNKTAIAAATSVTYTLVSADAGKYISFEVTPRDGTAFGTALESSKLGAIVTGSPGYQAIYNFENLGNNNTSFTSSTVNFTLTGNFIGQNISNYGSDSPPSAGYMDTGFGAGLSGNVGGLKTNNHEIFKLVSIDVWPSANMGSQPVLPYGTPIKIIGKRNGLQIAEGTYTSVTFNQTPDAAGGNWHRVFVTGTLSSTDIDEFTIELLGNQNYMAVDQFSYKELRSAPANTPPTATLVTITGTLAVGQTLTGTYTYEDAESNTENGSTFKWYRSDNTSGTNKTAIASATSVTYTLVSADADKYISFEVTPRDGTAFGTAVESVKMGPIISAVSILYVNKNVIGGTGTGNSWINAKTELADALKEAKINTAIKEIWVAKGVYKPKYSPEDGANFGTDKGKDNTFLLVNNVKIYGGFSGNESALSERDLSIATNTSILSGDLDNNDGTDGTINGNNAYHVVLSSGAIGTAILNGFTIKGGNASAGGTILVNANTIDQNKGGGVAIVQTANLSLSNLDITLNSAASGAGISNVSSSPFIEFTSISYNKVFGGDGAGIANRSSSPKIVNSIIHHNGTAYRGGGIYNILSAPELINVTISDNIIASNGSGAGLINDGGTCVISNSIIWGDNTSGIDGNPSTVKNSIVKGGYNGTNIINQDPKFNDAANGNYTLNASSPALNKGNNSLFTGLDANTKDLAGNARVYKYSDNGIIDLGAYEIQSDVAIPTVASVSVPANSTYTIGQDLDITINFDEAITVVTTGGTPRIALTVGTTTLYAEYVSGSGGSALTFRYTVVSGDVDGDGIDVGALSLNGGTLKNSTGNDATLTLNNIGSTAGVLVDGTPITSQTIIFNILPVKTYGDTDLDPGATSDNSGIPITYTSSNTNVATIVDGKIHIIAAGSSTITASQAGDATHNAATNVQQTLTVNKKTITVTAAAKSKTYGDIDPALTYTSVPALVTGDSFTGSLTRTPGENVGTYAINQGTLALNSNYTLTYVDADLTIGTKAITVTAAAKSKTYGNVDPALTYISAPSLVTGDSFSGSLTRLPGENVGTYAINQGTLALSSNYTLTYVGADLTIGAKTIKVTAAAKSKTYGDADPALTYTFAPALVTGDTFTGSLSRIAGQNVGTYAINQGTLALNSNYTLTYVDADLTIGTKTITVTAAAKSKTYGDVDPGLTYTFAPALVTGDSFSGNLTRSPVENVGTYAINQGTLALNSNYTLTYVDADLTIGTKTITVTAAAKSKTYGDANPTLTYTFVPALVGSDTFTGSLTRQPGENVGIYAINQGILALNANYTLTYAGANLTIGKKTITVTAAAKSKTYGDADPALTYTFAPALVTGDNFTGSLTRLLGENVGIYAINQGTLALNANYTLTYAGANLTIGKKTITVTAAAKSKTYGDADPALTYTFAPALVTGDNFTGSLTRLLGENVGVYSINQGTLALNSNYTLTYVDADLTIGTKTITVTAAAKSKTYGDADPGLTYTFAPALVTGDSFSGSLTRSPGENVGTYAINQGTLALSSNYTLTYVDADLTIGTKTITVTAAAKSKTYGDADPALTYTFAPALVIGDNFTGSLTRLPGENVGTYAINQGTLALSTNYTLTYVGADLTIGSKNITVTAAAKSKTYGDTDPALTYTFAPVLVTGDSFTGILTRQSGENVGTYAINQGSIALNANYTLTYIGADLTIGSKTITVTAAAKSKTFGDADPALTYTFSPALQTGDTFTGSLTRQTGENIGTYAINQGTLALSNNYSLTYVGADLTIGAKTITVTAVAKSKTYGTADPVLTYTFAPVLVTADNFTGSLTRQPGENVGIYAINQGTLALSNNYSLTYVGANLTIGSKTITVTAAAKSKTYGDADPALTYTFAPALVTGDNFTGSLTRLLGENVGTYAINQGTLALNANYTLTYVGANLTIGKKTITVTAAAKSKTYGEADPALTYTFAPALVTGDSFSGSLSRTAGQNVGMYEINQGTLALNANYTLTYVGSNFSITAKPITVTANASQSKVYGTADPVYTYSFSPALVSGDSFTGALTRAAGNDAGTYQITQGTLSAGTNYTLTYIGNNFTIVKANQTITWNQTLGFGCEGESTVVLTATSNSGLPVSYTSSNSNLVSISGNSLNLLNYGSVTISASQLGNNNYNPAVVVTIPLINSQPNLIRKQFENIIFFDNSSKSFNTYTWYKNGVLVAGQTDQYFKENGPLNGTYYAVATKLNGIVVTTCPLVLSPTVEEEYIKIVPNPVKPNGTYELLTNVSSSRLQNARVEVYSVGGLLMENKTTSQNTVSLKAPMVEGIYIVKMTLANGKYFTKNVLVKN